jgi:hypothetical protein
MIIPMVIMQLGILMDYWGDFSKNAWSVHIHYWTGTLWYLYLIIQPYYAVQGQMKKHRTNGIIGIFIAGAVTLTALSMLHRDIETAHRAVELADQFGPFKPWFFYGVICVEIIMILAFGYAVVKSILHRKELENHSWWLISSVFIIMFPALARGIQNVWIMIYGFSVDTDIMTPLYLTSFIIIGMTIWASYKYGRIKHPATYLAISVNLVTCLIMPLGKSESIQAFLESMIKG